VNSTRLFLCGDVMTGRGIDQILPHPSDPTIHEGYLDSALGYVRLAEGASGPIPRAVEPSYIWGDALAALEGFRPDRRIINLETAVTCSGDWLPKGINYRMNPANVACLTAAGIDCCVLANNHVLDWGERGLIETLDTLSGAGLRTAGAGASRSAAEAPAALQVPGKGCVLVYAVCADTSGVPSNWAATARAPGVALVPDLSQHTADQLAERIRASRQPGDLVVLSMHWGGNWGYAVAADESRFAHALIDARAVDVFHGHSSHHPKAIEIYRDRLIVYGCGDFINDYEGISGHEEFRGELGLMYLPELEAGTGRLLRLELVATRMKRFRVQRASAADTHWLCAVLDREGARFGTRASPMADGRIELERVAAAGAASHGG
jgi:poly-gamma-glutamate capsule biosynthesis protein CapA/YwtB (metallophosphatase superfamily)